MSHDFPNILASRYASSGMVDIWTPSGKVILEREFWLAVLEAQNDLGVSVDHQVIEDYRRVAKSVDLASIDARERVTKHDVKARIEKAGMGNHVGLLPFLGVIRPAALSQVGDGRSARAHDARSLGRAGTRSVITSRQCGTCQRVGIS